MNKFIYPAGGFSEFHSPYSQKLTDDLCHEFAMLHAQREELFLKWCFAKHLPPNIVRHIVPNNPSLIFISLWLQGHGYVLKRYPDDKLEFFQHDQVLETLPSPKQKPNDKTY